MKCYLCPKEFGTIGLFFNHFLHKHKEEFQNNGWPKIKAKLLGTPEGQLLQKMPIAENIPSQPQVIKPPMQVEVVTTPEEFTGAEVERPETVELIVDQNKPFEMHATRTMPKAMKMDSRIDVLFSLLKNQGILEEGCTIGDFINQAVMDYVGMKYNIDLAGVRRITGSLGNPNTKEVMYMGGGFGTNPQKEKTLDEMLDDVEKRRVRESRIRALEMEAKKVEAEAKPTGTSTGDFIDRVNKLVQQMAETKMAENIINRSLGGNDGKTMEKNKEVEELKQKLAKLEEDKKIEAIVSKMDAIKEQIRTQKPTGEIGAKELFSFLMQSNKQQEGVKDQLHSKDIESIKALNEMQAKMLTDKIDQLGNRPNIVNQVKEITDTAKALKETGFLKEGSEKSGIEIVSGLIENVATSVTGSPGFQNFMSNIGKQPEQESYTPEQLQKLQALYAQQQAQQQPQQQTQPQPRAEEMIMPPQDSFTEKIAANLVNISDQGDRKRRDNL